MESLQIERPCVGFDDARVPCIAFTIGQQFDQKRGLLPGPKFCGQAAARISPELRSPS